MVSVVGAVIAARFPDPAVAPAHPLVGDRDGDGRADYGVHSGTDAESTPDFFRLSSAGGSTFGAIWGIAADRAISTDRDGDGRVDDVVVRANDPMPSQATFYTYGTTAGIIFGPAFGFADDVPVFADYDGDGIENIAVYRPSTSTFYVLRSPGVDQQVLGIPAISRSPRGRARLLDQRRVPRARALGTS